MANAFIIFAGDATWRIAAAGVDVPAPATVAVSPDAAPEAIADAVAAALRDAGCRGGPVMLAVPSAWCLCAPVATAGLPAKGRRRAMVYRLEERLPVSAEDVVGDFVGDGPAPLGVCVEVRRLAPLAAALEAAGVRVEAICPASLLALQRVLARTPAPADGPFDAVVLAPSGGHAGTAEGASAAELFLLADGLPRSWYVLADDAAADLALHLRVDQASGGPRVARAIVHGQAPEVADVLARQYGAAVTSADEDGGGNSIEADAAALAAEVLAGRAVPWVNLRRDALASRDPLRPVRVPLTAAVAAGVLLLAAACGAMLWRAAAYDRLAVDHAAAQAGEYRRLFPGRPAPGDVRSRLAAEERSLRGASGGGADAAVAGLPPAPPGLVGLRDLLAALPGGGGVRYRVLELRLDGDRFTIEGQATAHADADAIARALRHGPGVTVDPPRTEQLPAATGAAKGGAGGRVVTFVIAGTIAPASSPGAAPAVAPDGRRASR